MLDKDRSYVYSDSMNRREGMSRYEVWMKNRLVGYVVAISELDALKRANLKYWLNNKNGYLVRVN